MNIKEFLKENKAMVVVEATLLFPIVIMILFALILLTIYLPTRAVLQNATQQAATAIAISKSDAWIDYDASSASYVAVTDKDDLDNVYIALIKGVFASEESDATEIVTTIVENSIVSQNGTLEVEYGLVNYVLYKEVVVTATKTIPTGVNLSFIGFPNELEIKVTSCATVQDGDELVRDIDLVIKVLTALDEKYNISEKFSGITEVGSKVSGFLGW